MEDNQSLFPVGNSYENIKLDVITEVIIFSQLHRKLIIKEHKKMLSFYKNHPNIFLSSLMDTKRKLEDLDELNEFDKSTLDSINQMTGNYEDVECYFSFQEDFLLDSYQKIYIQLSKLDRDYVKQSEYIDILFYSLTEEKMDVPVGEKDEKGIINTGSRLQLEFLKVSPKTFIYLYQTLLN